MNPSQHTVRAYQLQALCKSVVSCDVVVTQRDFHTCRVMYAKMRKGPIVPRIKMTFSQSNLKYSSMTACSWFFDVQALREKETDLVTSKSLLRKRKTYFEALDGSKKVDEGS